MPSNALDGRRRNGVAKHSRVRSGCLVCRQRRKKCDERRPQCQKCERMGLDCSWPSSYIFRVVEPGVSESSEQDRDRTRSRGPAAEVAGHDHSLPPSGRPSSSPTQLQGQDGAANSQPAASAANAGSGIEATSLGDGGSRSAHRAQRQQPLDGFAAIDEIPEDWLQQMSDTWSWSPLEPIMSQSPDAFNMLYPNAEYRALHKTLYNYMVDTARSGNVVQGSSESLSRTMPFLTSPRSSAGHAQRDPVGSTANLTARREQELWSNYLDEITDWLDMFDNDNHFKTAIPTMAQTSGHLRLAVLALSSRQLERKDPDRPYVESLKLYSEAIQLINTDLPSMSTAVIASCVLLCVLEMMSSSPNEWARHLDGCAMLITAAGIHGAVGGMRQAIFWCFARME